MLSLQEVQQNNKWHLVGFYSSILTVLLIKPGKVTLVFVGTQTPFCAVGTPGLP
jgi:hypothetical protein